MFSVLRLGSRNPTSGFPNSTTGRSNASTRSRKRRGKNAKLVQLACASPNEGGRSSYIVAGLSAWWLTMHNHGKVGITTADTKQLNEQIIPALDKCCARMGWKAELFAVLSYRHTERRSSHCVHNQRCRPR